MSISDKEFCESVHITIHSVRLIPGYKSSEMEKKIGKLVREKYADTCKECREINESIKNIPPAEGFFSKLGKAMTN